MFDFEWNFLWGEEEGKTRGGQMPVNAGLEKGIYS